ncbi:TetR/AcrR family transcriptional regulator [Nitratireductor sp. ZSWI3]|uniref:TetR/AcrR family transcriptional regulator n=1 Tax=Nitratireductor sp. ZSWI3 TaxID=2966359 RepID=UPI0021500398|nr:TetR/AcrR family transcriptional regulator [Nitratireductor sp. ZSWI3]MCR4269097.1 TetR/AcrR family transcriptional regulator [Nitratireductor sp. ZSWI3]
MAERGRPRAFDRDEALHRAMRVFWTCGYEGASVSELAQAMGINKPSLYAAFGCKEELFREAIALYGREEGAPVGEALAAGRTARGAIEMALRVNARSYTNPDNPRGCMVVVSALAGAPENNPVCRFLAENRRESEESFRRRVERGIAEGDVLASADPARVAAFYATVMHGLSIQARDGASAAALEKVVDSAMAAWETVAS